jgi:sigma-B regulation protein RsbU (phosphoserine phosphatase)
MANVQAALRALAPLDLGLSELAARVNDLIHDNTAADRFITAFLMILDPLSGRVDYVNAGHNPPFYLYGIDGKKEVRGLVEGGLILGVMPTSFPYESGSLVLEPGECIVMYTDGVTEAMNRRREEYGEDRLIELLCRVPSPGPGGEEIYRTVVDDVERFADGAKRSDDVTVICLERIPAPLQ